MKPIELPANWAELEDHSLANLWPMMNDSELAVFQEDMNRTGYSAHWPIVLFEGKVLDGRNRRKAAIALGFTPCFVDFGGTFDEATDYVLQSSSRASRINDEVTKCEQAFKLATIEGRGNPLWKNQHGGAIRPAGPNCYPGSIEWACEKTGASSRSFKRYKRVMDSKDEEMIASMLSRQKSLRFLDDQLTKIAKGRKEQAIRQANAARLKAEQEARDRRVEAERALAKLEEDALRLLQEAEDAEKEARRIAEQDAADLLSRKKQELEERIASDRQIAEEKVKELTARAEEVAASAQQAAKQLKELREVEQQIIAKNQEAAKRTPDEEDDAPVVVPTAPKDDPTDKRFQGVQPGYEGRRCQLSEFQNNSPEFWDIHLTGKACGMADKFANTVDRDVLALFVAHLLPQLVNCTIDGIKVALDRECERRGISL